MKITRVSINRPVGTILIIITAIVLGFFSIPKIPVSFWPKFVAPTLIVTVPYPGVSPEEVESQIAVPLEEELSTVDGVDEIETICMEGLCQEIIRFNWGINFDEAKLTVQDKTNRARSRFPVGVLEPKVLQVQDFIPPGIELGFYSTKRDLNEVRDFIESKLKNRLLRLKDVATVQTIGGNEQEVVIKVNPDKLYSYGITLSQINAALTSENMNIPAGKITTSLKNYYIRTIGELKEIEDIKNIIISYSGGAPVFLKDIAGISFENKERNTITRINGKEIAGLSIREKSGGNMVAMCTEVKKELQRMENELPSDIKIVVIQDQSLFVKKSIRNVLRNAGIGALLAGFIILLFLGNVRNTLIIAISIPISIITTFILIDKFNLTINTISLGGLALGVGMIVDSSVVVIENIFRHLQEKGSTNRFKIIMDATDEVAQAITASTLTSIVVFLPLVFLMGLFAVLLGELALTVVFALSISVIVSLTVVPMLSFKLMKTEKAKSRLGLFTTGWQKFFEKISNIYRSSLNFSLNHRILTIFIAIIILTISIIILIPRLDVELLPSINEGEFRLEILLPESTRLNYTNKIAEQIEHKIMRRKEVEKVYTVVGIFSARRDLKPNFASITVTLKKEYYPYISSIMEEMREEWSNIPGAKIAVRQIDVTEGMKREPVNVRIGGNNLSTLNSIGERILNIIKEVPGVININSSVEEGLPEFAVRIDRIKAGELGITTAQVARTLRASILGISGSRLTGYGNEYDINIKLDNKKIPYINELFDIPLKTMRGITVPLRAIASVSLEKGPSEIKHFDQQRVVEIKADISGRAQRDVLNEIKNKLKNYPLPSDYFITYGGQSRAITDSFRSLIQALIIAIFLVYVVMGAQFNSFRHPFIIALTIPLSLVGILLGLYVFGASISMNALLGVIMLVGIVVNNGILLIDYINQLRIKGMKKNESIIKGGSTRLRPILITSLTTIFGMLPIAIGLGEGGEALKPLGAVVVGGLTTSMLLTLFIIPCVYSLLDRSKIE
ncbi:AcrB/AcrD/AcrF family protein [candidate division KSB1 bacterium]|nr:MAG: AcrB/AcrD/AcrF family protein [candidate division KSB1 bacterium]